MSPEYYSTTPCSSLWCKLYFCLIFLNGLRFCLRILNRVEVRGGWWPHHELVCFYAHNSNWHSVIVCKMRFALESMIPFAPYRNVVIQKLYILCLSSFHTLPALPPWLWPKTSYWEKFNSKSEKNPIRSRMNYCSVQACFYAGKLQNFWLLHSAVTVWADQSISRGIYSWCGWHASLGQLKSEAL